jgi:hypothetical protein
MLPRSGGPSVPFWCRAQRVHGLGPFLPTHRFAQDPLQCVTMRLGDKAEARQALAMAPGDLITTYNLAQALLELDPDEHRDEADRLLLQVIEAQPYGKLANKANDLGGSIAARDLRSAQPEGLRQDAVSYCLQALQLFEGMDQQRFIAVLSEVAAVGQGGLQINEPGTARILKNLPGSWSDLALACLIHVGIKRLTPDQDSGLGIGLKYEEAVRLLGG